MVIVIVAVKSFERWKEGRTFCTLVIPTSRFQRSSYARAMHRAGRASYGGAADAPIKIRRGLTPKGAAGNKTPTRYDPSKLKWNASRKSVLLFQFPRNPPPVEDRGILQLQVLRLPPHVFFTRRSKFDVDGSCSRYPSNVCQWCL